MELRPEDDLSGSYQQFAQLQSQNAVIGDFRRRLEASQPAVEAAPAAAASSQIATPPGIPRIRVTPKRDDSVVGRVAADIGGGMAESAPAIVGGVNDAVRNTVGGLRSMADWLGTHLGGEIPFPNTGNEMIDKIIQRPLSALEGALPEKVKEQSTTTGQIIREGARFITGFVPAVRALGSGVGGSIAAGGVADLATMDPTEKGLSNLIQTVPSLKNPVTEYLASNPDDPEVLNRLRKGVEGAGFGAIAEGVVRGIRTLAHGRRVKTEIELQQQQHGEVLERDMMALGDPKAPLVSVRSGQALTKLRQAEAQTATGVPDQVGAKSLAGADTFGVPVAGLQDKAVFINFGRMETADDVKAVIKDTARAFRGEIDEARRGVQSNEHTKALADNLGMTVEDLLARQAGQPFNAEQSLAARRLWTTSAEKLTELAKRAADPNAGSVDLYNFRKMLAVHHAIQSEVIAARTETARALQAWSIPANSGGVEKARQIEMLLEGAGGNSVSSELARRIATLQGQGVPPGALSEAVRRGWAATTMDAVKEAYVLGLLWNPTTHVVNSASNAIVAFQQVYERSVAGRIGDFLGSSVDARVADGEAIAMAYGMITSLKDAFRLSARALRTGQGGEAIGKLDLRRDPAISSASVSREMQHSAADAQAFAETPMGRGIDFIGTATRLPGNALAAGDEFFKTLAFRGEVHAQALRQATQEGRTGPDLFRRMAEIANSPPEHIRLAAADAALYSTFQQRPGEWAQALMQMRNAGTMNPTFLVLPFIKTPANILRYTFERSPLAPLVGQWRDDIAAGGARRDLALARMATGTAVLSVAMDMASSGLITGAGPTDAGKKEALMRQGWQPNSIVVDGKYYSFNRADPMGTLLGVAGTIAEKMKEKDNSPEDFDQWEEVVASVVGAISSSIVDKTYFKGVTEILDAIHGAEKGSSGVARFIDRQTGSMLPMSSAFGTVERIVDPTQREVNSPWDGIKAKIAGLSDSLPPSRDLWGKERAPQEVYGRVFDAFTPVAVRERQPSPIDAEIERLGASVQRIKKKGEFQGAEVNFREFPEVYDEYVRLAGNELKHPAYGLGAKDFLDSVVSGQNALSSIYQQIYTSGGPDGTKAAYIKNVVAEYRKLAQQHIMSEGERGKWPDFVAYVEARKAQKQELKMPGAQ